MRRIIAIATLCLATILHADVDRDTLAVSSPDPLRTTVSCVLTNRSAESTFLLEGNVISLVKNGWIIFRDTTGGMFAKIANKTTCHPGQRILAIASPREVPTPSGKTRREIVFTHIRILKDEPESVAPIAITPSDLVRINELNYRRVSIHGSVTDILPDEIDPEYRILFIESNGTRATVSIFLPSLRKPLPEPDQLIDAEVSAVGVFLAQPTAGRLYRGPHITNYDGADITITRAAPAAPFEECPLTTFTPADVARAKTVAHRSRTAGRVTATFDPSSAFLALPDGQSIRVRFASHIRLPPVGAFIDIAGFVRSNVFFPQLDNAIWQNARRSYPVVPNDPERLNARYLLFDSRGQRRIKYAYDGHLIRIQGRITDIHPLPDRHVQIVLNSDDLTINAIAPEMTPPAVGTTVDITGVCMLLDSSATADDFARLDGFSIVLRTLDDLSVISTPPWWTVRRILVLLLAVLFLTALVLIWNILLHRLAERRGRQLANAQLARTQSELKKAERTRLSVELHDALSQSLTGIVFQLDASRHARVTDPAAADQHLDAAQRMLQGCRTELRRCIWDLRSSALDDPDFEKAIWTSVHPIACNVNLSVRSHVPRPLLNDNVAHAILRILRELVANAIRHGKATNVRIASAIDAGRFRFSVIDNGSGFQTDAPTGPEAGHFGLTGIRERLREMGGSLETRNTASGGAKVTFSIPFPEGSLKKENGYEESQHSDSR